jgi:hypothetical protein
VGGTGGVGSGQDGVHHPCGVVAGAVTGPPLGRQLGQGVVEHLHVVGGGVGAGVAGPQHPGQRLVGLVAPHAEGVEAKPPLVGGGGVLLVGVGVHQGGVEVKVTLAGAPPAAHTAARAAARAASMPPQLHRGDRLHRPPGGCVGGDRPEQRLLVAQHRQLGQAVGAIRDGHRQVGEDHARVVVFQEMPAVAHGHRHGLGQPRPVGQLRQQGGARVRHQPLTVGGHLHLPHGLATMHLQRALLLW